MRGPNIANPHYAFVRIGNVDDRSVPANNWSGFDKVVHEPLNLEALNHNTVSHVDKVRRYVTGEGHDSLSRLCVSAFRLALREGRGKMS